MLRVDPPDDLALVEAEADGVVGLPLARLPGGSLAGHDRGQAVEVGDDRAVDRLVEAEQACLVAEQLADGGPLLAGLGELGPVRRDPLVVVEPAARVGEGRDQGGHALRRREDEDHRVLVPGRAGRPVADAAPQVDDLLPVLVDGARAADLPAPAEVLGERVPYGLPARSDRSLDQRTLAGAWRSRAVPSLLAPATAAGLTELSLRLNRHPAHPSSDGRGGWFREPRDGTATTRASVEQTELPAARHGLDPVGGPELPRDRVEVGLHGAHRHEQLGRDLAVGPTEGDQAQDLELAGGERFDRASRTCSRGREPPRRSRAAPRCARASTGRTGRWAHRRRGCRARGRDARRPRRAPTWPSSARALARAAQTAPLAVAADARAPARALPRTAGPPRRVAARDRDRGHVGDRAADREHVAAGPQVGQDASYATAAPSVSPATNRARASRIEASPRRVASACAGSPAGTSPRARRAWATAVATSPPSSASRERRRASWVRTAASVIASTS